MKKLFGTRVLTMVGLGLVIAFAAPNTLTRAAVGESTYGAKSSPEAQSPEKAKQEQDESESYRHSPMVQTMGKMVGLSADQAATAFEITNFAILAALVGFFLLKSLPKTFRNRNTAIQKHLVDARTATEEATARLTGVEDRLATLDGQIAAMAAQSEKDSLADEQRIKASVEDEKMKILAAAEQEIAAATAQARKHLQQYAAELAIEQAGRRLVVSAETDRLLVQRFAERLGGDQSKKGQN